MIVETERGWRQSKQSSEDRKAVGKGCRVTLLKSELQLFKYLITLYSWACKVHMHCLMLTFQGHLLGHRIHLKSDSCYLYTW